MMCFLQEKYTLEIKELQLGDEGTFKVVMKNKIGETAQEATLSVARKYLDLN